MITENLENAAIGNPFNEDMYHMGQQIGLNVFVMFEKFPLEHHKYVIVWNPETGERVRISL